MPETVLISLITAGATLLGSLAGFFASQRSSKDENRRRLWGERHSCYSKLVSAYYALLSDRFAEPVGQTAVPSKSERDLYTQFQATYTSAVLICEAPTVNVLKDWMLQVNYTSERGAPSPQLSQAFQAAMPAMRKELLSPQK